MLIDFFYTLRAAKLPVSVKEYLTLLEALQAGVVGPNSDDAYKIDDFYYLARTTLVKDEKHFDKFDRAFAAYFKGVEMIADFTKDVPLEWLRKNLELELSPEEKAAIEKMGWDELMETLKKRFEEQKERHEGGNKMDRHRRHQPVRRLRLQPAGHPHRPGQGPQQERGQGLGPARLQGLRRHAGAGHAQHQGGAAPAAQVRARRLEEELDLRRHHPQHRRQRRLARHQDGARAAQQREGAAADGRGRHDGRAHPPRGRAVLSAAKTEFKHLEFYYFHNCVYDFMWKNNRRRFAEKFPTWDIIRKYNKDYKLIFVGDATMSPYEILQPGGSVEYNNEEAGAEWLQRLTHAFPKFAWINPEPQGVWQYRQSIAVIQQLMNQRMFPLTLKGLEEAMRLLSK